MIVFGHYYLQRTFYSRCVYSYHVQIVCVLLCVPYQELLSAFDVLTETVQNPSSILGCHIPEQITNKHKKNRRIIDRREREGEELIIRRGRIQIKNFK